MCSLINNDYISNWGVNIYSFWQCDSQLTRIIINIKCKTLDHMLTLLKAHIHLRKTFSLSCLCIAGWKYSDTQKYSISQIIWFCEFEIYLRKYTYIKSRILRTIFNNYQQHIRPDLCFLSQTHNCTKTWNLFKEPDEKHRRWFRHPLLKITFIIIIIRDKIYYVIYIKNI